MSVLSRVLRWLAEHGGGVSPAAREALLLTLAESEEPQSAVGFAPVPLRPIPMPPMPPGDLVPYPTRTPSPEWPPLSPFPPSGGSIP
jgi:hypothetical protein